MNKSFIRVIYRDENRKSIGVGNLEIDLVLNAIERPSYVEYMGGRNKIIRFIYTGSIEKYRQEEYNDLTIEYGQNSGRIRSILIEDEATLSTDWFHIYNRLKSRRSLRFSYNLEMGFKLASEVLSKIADKEWLKNRSNKTKLGYR